MSTLNSTPNNFEGFLQQTDTFPHSLQKLTHKNVTQTPRSPTNNSLIPTFSPTLFTQPQKPTQSDWEFSPQKNLSSQNNFSFLD